jgi:hypothetical protein
MLPTLSARKHDLPNISYGPFRLMEAVPWLMFATMLRFINVGHPPFVSVAFDIVEALSIFLAFLLASRRMIEFNGGQTRLGDLEFADQLRLGWKIIRYVFLLLFAAAFIGSIFLGLWTGLYLLLGFDGVAFDQFSHIGRLWSSILGAVVFLMVMQAANGEPVKLRGALKEFAARRMWLVSAVFAVFLVQMALYYIQGIARIAMFTWSLPGRPNNLVYFFFVFGFASVRLWATLAVLTFALRESYLRQGNLLPGAAS